MEQNPYLSYKPNGLLPQEIDERDYQVSEILPLVDDKLPESYEPPSIDFIYDQGDSSECCACAWNSIRYLQTQAQNVTITEKLSPSFTYANREESEIFEGMYLRSCCKKGRQGSVSWSDFPGYHTVDEAMNILNQNKAELLKKAYPKRISSFYACGTDDEVKLAIYNFSGVLCGINVTKSFYTPDEEGYIHYPETLESSYGGHAIVRDGWVVEDGVEYWRILNSWGEEWGKGGHCYISFKDFQRYVLDNGYAIIDNVIETNLAKVALKKSTFGFIDKIRAFFCNLTK